MKIRAVKETKKLKGTGKRPRRREFRLGGMPMTEPDELAPELPDIPELQDETPPEQAVPRQDTAPQN